MRRNRKTAYEALLDRYDASIEEIHKLKIELAREKETTKNYWDTIVWLRSTINSQADLCIESCPFCSSMHVGLEGSTSDSRWFVICDCGAMGPEADSEAEAIAAWNKAIRSND